MPTLQDVQKTALDDQGFNGTIDEQMKQWATANGATADQLQDAIKEALEISGGTDTNLIDLWYSVLISLGYSGTLSDMLYSFWSDGGTLVADVISLLFSTGDESAYQFPTRSSSRNGEVYKATGETRFALLPANEPVRHGHRQWENQFTAPDDLLDSSWGGSLSTVVTSGFTDPENGNAAFRLVGTGGAHVFRQTKVIPIDEIYANTWFVKSNTGSDQDFRLLGDSSSLSPDLTATSEWKPFSFSATTILGGGRSYGIIRPSTNADYDILVWHPQLENQTSLAVADQGIPNEFATDIGWSIFDNSATTVTSDVVTFAQGVLIPESQRFGWDQEPEFTNNIGEQRDLTHANYTAVNMTVAFDADGVNGLPNTGSTITATAANATVMYIPVTSASGNHATKWWLTRKTGTGNVELTLDNGATWQDVTSQVGSSMAEAIVDQAAVTNPQIGIRLVTSGDAVEVAQDELHLNTTIAELKNGAPIPDGAGTPFTKAADLLADATLGALFPQEGGACLVEWRSGADSSDIPAANNALVGVAAAGAGALYHQGLSNSFRTTDSTLIAVSAFTPFSSLTEIKIASYWGTGLGVIVDTNAGTEIAYDGAFASDGIFRAGFAMTHKMYWKSIIVQAPQPSVESIIGQQA